LKKITEENLISAYAGESQAHMRYLYYAKIAESEGFKNIARLFRAIAFSEMVHAHNHFKMLSHLNGGFITVAHAPFGPGNTVKNLEHAIMGEEFEIEEMYPTYLETAKFQNEAGAAKTFQWALEAEKKHAELYKEAKKSAEAGKDVEFGDIYVCEVCGYTVVGEAPDRCPVCGAKKEKFVKF